MGTLTITNTFCGTPYQPTYGLLYNWYAVDDSRKISSSDDWVIMPAGFYSGSDKETGTTYWDSPNTGATNARNLNVRGSGIRDGDSGGFQYLKNYEFSRNSPTADYRYLAYNSSSLQAGNGGNRYRLGFPQRLVNTSTSLSIGQNGTYTGNDGKVYRTIVLSYALSPFKIEVLADNLQETKFRNGDVIPYHGSNNGSNFTNAEWAALTTAGCCAYNNDVNNVAPGFSFPT